MQQHQSPHPDHVLSPTRSNQGAQVARSPAESGPGPPYDPRTRGQPQPQGQGYAQGQRHSAGQIPSQDWDDRQGPQASSQYPPRGQNYPRGTHSGDDYPQQHRFDDHMHAPSSDPASVRYGRGSGHVSSAKAILLPGPLLGAGQGQPGRGRGRGRADGSRGRGRNPRGRG